MSYFPDQQRPGMRRKSSAQNLLSSFKTTNSSNPSIPPPLNLGASSITSSNAPLSFSSVHQAATPTTTTPTVREWDAQSLHSDAAGSSLGGAGSPQITQGMSVEYLREMVNKRMITLTYIRSVHEGRSHWFHTVQMTRADLDRAFNNFEMKKRTPRFAILALSLSSLLEINQPQDLLKSLLTTVTEYDQAKDDGDKSRMRFLKGGKNARRGTNAGIPEFAGGFPDTSDLSGLFSSNIPFPLDYHETLISLIDVLSEVYNKISKLLGPSPFSSQANMIGPLGQLTPQPGVSYLFGGENVPTAVPNQSQSHHNHSSSRHLSTANIHQLLSSSQSSNDQHLSSSLWGIAHASLMPQGPGYGGALSSPPSGHWAPNFGEMLLKIDGKFKKITGMLLKDLDELARRSIQDELASLDPLLRNMAGPLENLPNRVPAYEYGEAL